MGHLSLQRDSDTGELIMFQCSCTPKFTTEEISAFDVEKILHDICFLDTPEKEPTTILGYLWEMVVWEVRLWKAKRYLEQYAR